MYIFREHKCDNNTCSYKENYIIKPCYRGGQTCALPLFCDHDLEINPITLKLEGELNILNMYLHTENEAARLRHSEL